MTAASEAEYVGPRAEYFYDLDRRECACGHRSLSHGYGTAYGNGACGFCPCSELTEKRAAA